MRKRKYDEWDEANPDKSWIHNPYHNGVGFSFDYKNYRPFDHTNVYFDDLMKKVSDEIKRYNRIAVIIQGLARSQPRTASSPADHAVGQPRAS